MSCTVGLNTYDIDTLIQFQAAFQDAVTAAPLDPTNVFFYLQKPDGTQVEYSSANIVRVSMGVYQITIEPDQPGPWIYKWRGTGQVEITSPDTYFNVSQSVLIS